MASSRHGCRLFGRSPHGCRVGLSIVVPVYRGAATVGRLVVALSALHPEGGLEIVLVNDGSPDNSDEVCQALVRSASVPLTYVEHARNYGEHNAVMTGLRHARGAYVITMDDDLQNPPEEVVRLYDHARLGGWDVVYTRYAVKQHDGWRNLGSRFANAVADRSAGQAEGPVSLLVPLHVGTGGAVRHPLQRTLPLRRWADHAGDAAYRQHRGAPSAARGRPLQLQSAPTGAALAQPGHQLFARSAAACDLRRRVHGTPRGDRRRGNDCGGAVPATIRHPAGPRR